VSHGERARELADEGDGSGSARVGPSLRGRSDVSRDPGPLSDDGSPSTLQERIRAAVRWRESGDVAQAHDALARLWPEAESGDPFDRLFFAHSFADVQSDPHEELRWDLVALATVPEVTPARAAEQGLPGGVLGLLPSLHLNLAEDYLRLGEHSNADEHWRAGLRHLDVLDDDSYGRALRAAFADFEERRAPEPA
jgi:hypothetical protein